MSESLQKRLYNNCGKIIKTDYPCDSCYGCKNELKLVEEWLLEKYRTIVEGCDNPHCDFCLDVKEKKGMVDHIFEGYLLEYSAKLSQTNSQETMEPQK